jgi:nucleotide-binding universal stress UspA family protein
MKVVLATDGNEPARAAATLLEALAHRDRTDLRVIAVNSFETVLAAAAIRHRYDPTAARREVQAALDVAVRRLREAGFSAEGRVEEGDPATEILEMAKREAAGLVVLGAGHTRWVDSLLLGSTSTAVLHTAPSSVLVVHEALGTDRSRVLVATDGSEGAQRAVQTLVALADPGRCTVRVIAVAETPSFAATGVRGDEAVEEALRVRAGECAEEAATALRAAGFTAETEVAAGHPATLLLERSRAYDLVAVGSRGLGALRRSLLGSLSDKLVRHARATLVAR